MSDPFKGLPVSLGLSSLSPQQKRETPPAVPLAMRHLPQRMHDQEKLYSPSLKTLAGGYGYVRNLHDTMRDIEEKGVRRYQPDFLNPLMPESSEEPAQQSVWELLQQQEDERRKGNNKRCVTEDNTVKCQLPNGRWVTLDGRLTSPPKGNH